MRRTFLMLIGSAVMALAATSFPPHSVATADAQPDRVDPAECRVAPLAVEAFLAFWATPSAVEWTRRNVHYEPPVPLPQGRPVADATVAALTAAQRELAACQEAGDDLRVFALYSDDHHRRTLPPDPAVRREVIESWATPAAGSDGIIPYQVVDAWVLDDGRIAALTDGWAPPTVPVAAGQTVRLLFVYVKWGERYLIDEFRYVDIGAVGTPTP